MSLSHQPLLFLSWSWYKREICSLSPYSEATPSSILKTFLCENAMLTFPKTVNKHHLAENFTNYTHLSQQFMKNINISMWLFFFFKWRVAVNMEYIRWQYFVITYSFLTVRSFLWDHKVLHQSVKTKQDRLKHTDCVRNFNYLHNSTFINGGVYCKMHGN